MPEPSPLPEVPLSEFEKIIKELGEGNKLWTNPEIPNHYCSICGRKGHVNDLCYKRPLRTDELNHLSKLESQLYIFICNLKIQTPTLRFNHDPIQWIRSLDKKVTLREKLFWRKFQAFVKEQFHENICLPVRLTSNSFANIKGGVATFWAIGAPIFILQRILAGWPLDFTSTPERVKASGYNQSEAKRHDLYTEHTLKCKKLRIAHPIPENFVNHCGVRFWNIEPTKRRPIWNGRTINPNIFIDKFTMIQLYQLLRVIVPDSLFATLDLSKYFYHLIINPKYKPYLCFEDIIGGF